MFASGTLPVEKYPYGYPDIYVKWNGKKQEAFNCNYTNEYFKKDTSVRYYTAPVSSFLKNSSGVYNMIGNVAEMVSQKGIAKGGSFEHKLEDCKIINDQHYTKPECWVGFRCVAVVEK